MLVNAETHLGTRSVLEYLLSPVQKVMHEAGQQRFRLFLSGRWACAQPRVIKRANSLAIRRNPYQNVIGTGFRSETGRSSAHAGAPHLR